MAATTRTRLHLPSRKPPSQEVQNPPDQIEVPDLASPSTPKSELKKESQNTLFHSDITEPRGTIFEGWVNEGAFLQDLHL